MSVSIRDRLFALALYHMVGAARDDDKPRSPINPRPISILERLYRLRLASAGIPWPKRVANLRQLRPQNIFESACDGVAGDAGKAAGLGT
jgi:hypothetical protein